MKAEVTIHPTRTADLPQAWIADLLRRVAGSADIAVSTLRRGGFGAVGSRAASSPTPMLVSRPCRAGPTVVGWTSYGQALLGRSVLEPGRGRFLAKNLAGYVVPVNADVSAIDASFVQDEDRHASTIGAKGIGEIGANGVAPAIANAIYHATGGGWAAFRSGSRTCCE